jgi:RNA polymerase sigma factor (sigma-70 family)
MDDLVQQVRLAFITAIHSYKSEFGARLSTWSLSAIKDHIQRGDVAESVGAFAISDRDQRLASTVRAIMNRTNVPGHEVSSFEGLIHKFGLTTERAATLRNTIYPQQVYLNAPVTPSDRLGDDNVEAFVADPNGLSPEVVTLAREAKAELERVLAEIRDYLDTDPAINERARKIYLARSWLDNREKRVTLNDLADQFGVTRQRVDQISNQVRERLANRGLPGAPEQIRTILDRIEVLAEV